jgi:hypothetical protein
MKRTSALLLSSLFVTNMAIVTQTQALSWDSVRNSVCKVATTIKNYTSPVLKKTAAAACSLIATAELAPAALCVAAIYSDLPAKKRTINNFLSALRSAVEADQQNLLFFYGSAILAAVAIPTFVGAYLLNESANNGIEKINATKPSETK